MKKKYMRPAMNIVSLNMEDVIAQSFAFKKGEGTTDMFTEKKSIWDNAGWGNEEEVEE